MNNDHFIIGRSRHDRRMDMTRNHFHHRYEMYYLISGERFYLIDHNMYLVQPGDLVFINRYALHRTTDTGLAHHERILIQFSSEFLHPLDRTFRTAAIVVLRRWSRTATANI